MNKIVLMIAASLLIMSSYAQLDLGLKGAITMSKLTTDVSEIEKAAKTSFQLGAYARLGKKLHLQPELYFTAKKGELTYKTYTDNQGVPTEAEAKQTITLNTIDVPVLLGYTIFDLPAVDIHLQAGPAASFVINKNFDITIDGNGVDEEDAGFDKDDFNDINWALQFGGGVDVLFLTIDLRYELGLNNLYKEPEGTTEDTKFKNNVFFLSVGFKIL
jgi:hypothetical protein